MSYTKTNWVNNTTPINETNLNKIESGIKNNDINIGEENYDNTKTYEVGDIVRYNEKIYKCITAITTAENFDISKWEQTNIVEIVQSEKSKIYELIEALSTPIVGEGENITLNDTAEKRFENFDIEGNSEQEASPSPDYPSEVKSCGDNINLFDKETVTKGKYMMNGTIGTNSNYVYSDYIEIGANQDFIWNTSDGTIGTFISYYNSSKTYISGASSVNNISKTTPENCKYIIVSFDMRFLDIAKIEKGKNITAYSPYGQGCINEVIDNGLETTDTNYQSQTYTIPTQQPMRSIGDTRDKFILKENGKWYERHYGAEIIIDGTETINKSSSKEFFAITKTMSNLDTSANAVNISKSNYGTGTTLGLGEGNTNNKYSFNASNIYLDCYGSNINTVDKLKAQLSETPMKIYALLKTPLDIECTSEQTEILNQMYIKAKSYKGVTHIYSNDEVSPNCYVEAVKDLTTLIQ